MKTMRVAQIPAAKQAFEIVERPIPEPAPGTVRIKVEACGVCHSDSVVKEGHWPGLQYPRVPGTKWPARSTPSGRVYRDGSRDSASVSAGIMEVAPRTTLLPSLL
jgi:NADPH:quinone reductase-like Zn-dependent oxidoreductase